MALILVDCPVKKAALLQLQSRKIDQIIVIESFEEAEQRALRQDVHFIFFSSAPYQIRGIVTNPSILDFCRTLCVQPNDSQMASLTRAFKRNWTRDAGRFFGTAPVGAAAQELFIPFVDHMSVEAQENDPVCISCRENVASMCLSGCGHQIMCPDCLKQWKAQTCPMCREPYKVERCLRPIVPDSCIKRC